MASSSGGIAKTATEALKILWADKFFKGWQKKTGIEKKLSGTRYNSSSPKLGMALKRAKHLTRKGSRGTYQYIQKYPFFEDTPARKPKKA
jgi:hypothetical protein